MEAGGTGHYEFLLGRRDAALVTASPAVRARILGLRPDYSNAKETRIIVDCRSGVRSIERVLPTADTVAEKPVFVRKIRSFSPPPETTVRLAFAKNRKPYALMSEGDRDEVKRTADALLKIVGAVSGFHPQTIKDTWNHRSRTVSKARILFYVMLAAAHPHASLQEMARQLQADHTGPHYALRRFHLHYDLSPMKEWISHPAIDLLRPRLMAFAETKAGRL